MAGRNDFATARARLAAACVALSLLVACGGFDPRAEGALDGYTAEEIYQRGEYELARTTRTTPPSTLAKSNGFIPIPNGRNAA